MIKIRRRDSEIPMASMSDIAFLLIIFFIISMAFIYNKGLPIVLPSKNAKPMIISEQKILMLKLDRNGNLFLNNIKETFENFNKLKFKNKDAAIINIDEKCKYKYLVNCVDILQKKGINKISFKKIGNSG